MPAFLVASPFRDLAAHIGCHEAALRLIFSLLLGTSLSLSFFPFPSHTSPFAGRATAAGGEEVSQS